MMIGKQDPFDAFHSNLTEMSKHAAVAKIDQQRSIAVTQDINVAGVRPGEQVGSVLRGRTGERGGESGRRRDAQNSAHEHSRASHKIAPCGCPGHAVALGG
jgi:hypothetical protein